MSELSIFIDESGDFGEYEKHAPYYIISMVFHDQSVDIREDLAILERELSICGYPNHCIHSGPLIRGEFEYRNIETDERKKILRRIMTFFRHVDILHKTFFIEKRQVQDSIMASGLLSKKIATFIKSRISFFADLDKIIVYYDNGHVEVNRILASIFNVLLDNVEFRRVYPSDYRLFQIADLMCTLQLLKLKLANNNISRSISGFSVGKSLNEADGKVFKYSRPAAMLYLLLS